MCRLLRVKQVKVDTVTRQKQIHFCEQAFVILMIIVVSFGLDWICLAIKNTITTVGGAGGVKNIKNVDNCKREAE